jgi:predicted metal-binding membrane protein
MRRRPQLFDNYGSLTQDRPQRRVNPSMDYAAAKLRPLSPGATQLGLIFLLLLAAAVAWGVTGDRMAGMDAGPGTPLGSLGFYVTVWVVMMAAMMLPSIIPMVLGQARLEARRRERGEPIAGTTAAFVAGYLLTWAAAGLIFYALFELGRSLDIGAFAWDRGGPYLAGGVLFGAAVYQLTPLKDTCLRKCRHPMVFLTQAWRPGRLGALRMGIEHGGWCLGCCWALMAALFALGVMSLGWMAVIAALIAAEKLVPRGAAANRGIALFLVLLGLAIASTPESVPGLTLPDSPKATRAMDAMGMEMEAGPGASGMGHEDSMEGGTAGDPEP